jgi:hypothetical protein
MPAHIFPKSDAANAKQFPIRVGELLDEDALMGIRRQVRLLQVTLELLELRRILVTLAANSKFYS